MTQPLENEADKCTRTTPEECNQQALTQYYLYCLPRSLIGNRVDAVPQGEPAKQTGRVVAHRLQRLAEISPEKAAKILAAEYHPLQYSLMRDEEAAARALVDSPKFPNAESIPEPAVGRKAKTAAENLKPTKTQHQQTMKYRCSGGGGNGGYRGR